MGAEAWAGPPVTADPGGLASGEWRVRNTGEEPASFRLELGGDPAAWSWVTPASVTLAPGETAVAKVTFRPPRGSSPAAGPLPYQLRVVGTDDPDDPDDVTVGDGVVTVAPFTDLFVSLEPMTVEGRRSAQLEACVENRGNRETQATLAAVDPEDALALNVEPPAVEVAVGGRATATVTARPRARRLWGSPRPHPFQVVAEAPGAEPVRLGATFVHRALPRSLLVLPAVAVLVVGLVGLVVLPDDRGPVASPTTPLNQVDTDERDRQSLDRTCPARGHLATEANGLVRPGPAPLSYSFLFVKSDDCTPYRFNPCEPIRYVTNEAHATPDHRADLAEGLRRVTEATGIEFLHEGPTDEEPGPRGPYVRRYGERWAPVLIAWVKADTIAAILRAGTSRGAAAATTTIPATAVTGAGAPMFVGEVYVSGVLLINIDAVDPATRGPIKHGFGPGLNWGRVLLHELGHLLGLGHVQSRTSIMLHELRQQRLPNANWGIGDRNALRVLGREWGCEQTPVFSTRPPVPPPGLRSPFQPPG
jgi:hypothetical protein